MEEVLEKFQATVLTPEKNAQSEFADLYKNWGRQLDQEERRKELLKTQKINRNQKIDKVRGILDIVHAVEEKNKNIFRLKKHYRYRPNIYVAGFHKTSHTYDNVLMMSEWMIEKPEDFYDNWYVVPCPKGVRVLGVAFQNSTKLYTKYGHFIRDCRTVLPGGSPISNQYRKCCIFDGVYVEKMNTVFILDLIAWNNLNMADGETEFRHFWLESQLAEISGYNVMSKHNNLILIPLPKVPCKEDLFKEFMMKYPHFNSDLPKMDGLLFYHKYAHYVAGQTPLVGWLYPYMVPEVLGSDIPIHNIYIAEKPIDYKDQISYIEEFESKCSKKNKRRPSINMDTSKSQSLEKQKKNGVQTANEAEKELVVETMVSEETATADIKVIEDEMEIRDVQHDNNGKDPDKKITHSC